MRAVTGAAALAPPQRFVERAGVASLALASVLGDRARPARLLAVFPTAVYLETADLVVAVVTGDAVRLPNAVVIPVPSSEGPFAGVTHTTAVSVGGGLVTIGPLTVRVTRWWDPQVRTERVDASTVQRQVAAMAAVLAGDARQPGVSLPLALVHAWLGRDLQRLSEEAGALVGLGPGLTPSGDDLLAGMLAAFSVLGGDAGFAGAAGAVVTALATGRTTSISATLLSLAAAGEVSAEAAAVLRAMASGRGLEPAVRTLLAVGHTSGADVAAGLLAGAVAATGMVAEAALPRRVRT